LIVLNSFWHLQFTRLAQYEIGREFRQHNKSMEGRFQDFALCFGVICRRSSCSIQVGEQLAEKHYGGNKKAGL